MERKSTKFSVFLASGALVLGGCAASTSPAPMAKAEETKELEVRVPLPPTDTSLALLYGTSRVRVGDLDEEVIARFPRAKSATALSEDPPVWLVGARVSGWESEAESFAVLSLDGRVVCAVHTVRNAPWSTVHAARYAQQFGKSQQVSNPPVTYEFWENADAGERLMICRGVASGGKPYSVTAVGLSSVMHELRMDPEAATADAARASKLLQKQASSQK